jgi:response regulator RpfG family c-di-GMP phosphodiesterase
MARLHLSVLILESDEATLNLYCRELGRVYRVIACRSEREAVACLRSEMVQALVVEPAIFPDCEWSFITAVRTNPETARLPIILCSTLDLRRRGAELGVAATLIKPVMPQTLFATVTAVMQSPDASESTS